MKIRKLPLFLGMLAVLTIGVLGAIIYQNHSIERSQMRNFTQLLCGKLISTRSSLDAVLTGETTDVSAVSDALRELDTLLWYGNLLIDRKLPTDNLSTITPKRIADYLEGGAITPLAEPSSTASDSSAKIPDPSISTDDSNSGDITATSDVRVIFVADGTLSPEEQQFLRVLQSDLKTLHLALADNDGLNGNPNLTVSQFNAAWNTFFSAWYRAPFASSPTSSGASWRTATGQPAT